MEVLISWGLPILKFISIGLTGVFGIVALLVDYKNEEGQITKWGKRALIGVILSTVVAAGTTGLELVKGEKEAAKTAQKALLQAQQTNKIIKDINRSLHPFKKLEFGFWAKIHLDAEQLHPFTKRFSRAMNNFVREFKKGAQQKEGIYASISSKDGPEAISVPLWSQEFPSESNETTAYYLFRYIDFHLEFYKEPIAPDHFEKPLLTPEDFKEPDLRINIGTSELDHFGIAIEYNVQEKTHRVHASSIESDPRYWRSSGKIIAIPDLVGAQMFIFTDSIVVPSFKGDNSKLKALRSNIQLDKLIMNIAGGREFWFRYDDLEEHMMPNRLRYFVVTLSDGLKKYER